MATDNTERLSTREVDIRGRIADAISVLTEMQSMGYTHLDIDAYLEHNSYGEGYTTLEATVYQEKTWSR